MTKFKDVVLLTMSILISTCGAGNASIARGEGNDRLSLDGEGLAHVGQVQGSAVLGMQPLSTEADAVKENFGDWAVECRRSEEKLQCLMGQYQEDSKTGKTIVAIEIFPPDKDGAQMAIFLPLGLSIADGVSLELDDQVAQSRGYFATCVRQGCIAPFAFTTASIEAMQQAKSFRIIPVIYRNRVPATFTISLRGFSSAWGRLVELQKLAE